jgi:hypothetical protein
MAKSEPLLAYLTRTVGIWRAAKVGGYIAAWGLYSDSLDPGARRSIEGCGDYWRRSHASMWREHRLFHEAFPDEANPERIWQSCKAEADRKSREKATRDLLLIDRNWSGAF